MQHHSEKSSPSLTSSCKSDLEDGLDLDLFSRNKKDQQSPLQQNDLPIFEEKSDIHSTERPLSRSMSFNQYDLSKNWTLSRKNRRSSKVEISRNPQILESNFEESTMPQVITHNTSGDQPIWQTQSSANQTHPTLVRDISTLEENGSSKNSIKGSEKDENLWGKRKMSVHNMMDFSLMIANIAQLRAVLTIDGNKYKNFILVCIITSMVFQIMFAICMIRRQNTNQQINQAFESEDLDKEKHERIRKRRRYMKILDEIAKYLVLFILVANGLITGFGFV